MSNESKTNSTSDEINSYLEDKSKINLVDKLVKEIYIMNLLC